MANAVFRERALALGCIAHHEGHTCDGGGVWGYADFLEALADPRHEEHEEFLEWRGPFDPEKFDAAKTTKSMRRGLPDWRQM